jgi:hypothetical protein
VAQVRNGLTELFPHLRWKLLGDTWLGRGAGHIAPHLDVLLGEDTPGQCHFVVLNKAAPSVMRRIQEHLGLNQVCAPEAADLVDPWGYEDDDRYYAKLEWKGRPNGWSPATAMRKLP